MNNKNNGGSAFPLNIPKYHHENSGMSLRDYFAAKAMQGYLANPNTVLNPDPKFLAEVAYSHADAMLEAREK